jgi:hypothetical protein
MSVFERARAIRMNGEPWQNAVQRAGSQLRYEKQIGGKEKSDLCHFHKKKKTCRLSAKGRKSPEHLDQLSKHPPSQKQLANRDRFGQFASEARGSKGKNSVAIHIKERFGPTGSRYGRDKARRDRVAKETADALGVPNLRGVQDGGKSDNNVSKSPRTAYCSFYKPTGRCHRTNKAREEFPREVPANTNPTSAQLRARERFALAARATKGIKDRSVRNQALKEIMKDLKEDAQITHSDQQGGWDGYSNTSSTRSSDLSSDSSSTYSSDFTSVSDTSSMSGGSWTSNDSSSLW